VLKARNCAVSGGWLLTPAGRCGPDQATDRAHRIGQDKAVFVYKLRTLGTVEEKILEMQRTKRELAKGLFTPGAKVATAISEADLASLFAPIDA
jgi:non-specific serine/threonine protein kinase